MTLDEYQKQAMSFRLTSADAQYALLNLTGEVGELMSLEAKAIRDGYQAHHMLNKKKELGDILWCLAAVAQDSGLSLSEIAEGNIFKLGLRKSLGTIKGSGDDR